MSTSVTNELLSYAPELKEFIKSAEQADTLSTNSKSETLFSCVKMGYMEKVAGVPVDSLQKAKVLKASTLYGVEKQASEIIEKILSKVNVKQASEAKVRAELVIAQDNFEAMTAGYVNQDNLVKMARALDDSYGEEITSESVKKYSGNAYLSKQAMERSLKTRFIATADWTFSKLAEALDNLDTDNFSIEEKRKLTDFIHGLDKKAGLTAKGFNIYEEVFLTKKASIASSTMVNLSPAKSVTADRIIAVAPDLTAALGDDVVKELSGDPIHVKQVVESLPLDIKAVIARYV